MTNRVVTPAPRRIPGHLVAQALAQARVEVGERLVQEHQIGGGREGSGERHALLLSAGELVNRAVPEPCEADQLERLGDALAVRATAEAVGDVAGDVAVREQGVVLEDHPDPPPLRSDELAGAGERAAGEADAPRVGSLEAGDQPQGGGLAAPRRPEQGAEAAGLDLEVEAVHRAYRAVGLRQAAELERGAAAGSLVHEVTVPLSLSR